MSALSDRIAKSAAPSAVVTRYSPAKPRTRTMPSAATGSVRGACHHSPRMRSRSAAYDGFGVPSARMRPDGAPSQAPASVSPQ